jgi:hypothetical protein
MLAHINSFEQEVSMKLEAFCSYAETFKDGSYSSRRHGDALKPNLGQY